MYSQNDLSNFSKISAVHNGKYREITLNFTDRTIISNSFMSFMELEEKKERLKLVKEIYNQDQTCQSQITQQIRTTFINTHQTSSTVTIFALVNSMTGSVVLLIPISFMRSGLLLSIIAMIIIGFVSYITCKWIIKIAEDSDEIGSVIQNILGQKYFRLFSFTSVVLMFGVGIVYFLLLNSTLYHVLSALFYYFQMQNYALPTEIKFNCFSIQWQAIILSFLFFPLFFVKRIAFLVKLGRLGTFALYAYIIFIFYLFIENISSGRLKHNWDEVKMFSPDFATILGNLSLAFMSQNSVVELMSINKDKENNQRDLKIAYIIIQIVYGIIGIFGSLGLVGRVTLSDPANIYDFFNTEPGNIPVMIMGLFFLIQIGTVFPFFNFISKVQLFNILQPGEPISFSQNYIYNLVFIGACLVIQIFLVNPSMIVGICGSIFGFILIYLIPILLRIKSNIDTSIDNFLKDNDLQNAYPQFRQNNNNDGERKISNNSSQKKTKFKNSQRKITVDSEMANFSQFQEPLLKNNNNNYNASISRNQSVINSQQNKLQKSQSQFSLEFTDNNRQSQSDMDNSEGFLEYIQQQKNIDNQQQDDENHNSREADQINLNISTIQFIKKHKVLSLGMLGLLLLGSILSMVQIFKLFNLI